MASEKWLVHTVDRFISLKGQVVMCVNYFPGTNSDQLWGADRWSVRGHSLGRVWLGQVNLWRPSPPVGHAHLRAAWVSLVKCSQDIRKGNVKKIPNPDELYPTAVREPARWHCLPAGRYCCEIVENGKLSGNWKEVNVLIFFERGKKVESGYYWPLIFVLTLTRNHRMHDSVMKWNAFKRKEWSPARAQ